LIINDIKDSVEKIAGDKKVTFTTYKAWNKDYIKTAKKFLQKIKIGRYSLPYSNLELAILESLYNPADIEKNYIYELVKKIIRKKWKKLDFDVFVYLLKNNKFHSSINRLYKLAKLVNPQVADKIKEIIKKYSYFIETD
jgi:integrase